MNTNRIIIDCNKTDFGRTEFTDSFGRTHLERVLRRFLLIKNFCWQKKEISCWKKTG